MYCIANWKGKGSFGVTIMMIFNVRSRLRDMDMNCPSLFKILSSIPHVHAYARYAMPSVLSRVHLHA